MTFIYLRPKHCRYIVDVARCCIVVVLLLLRNCLVSSMKWIIKCNIQVRLMLDDWPFGGFMCSIVPFTQSVSVFVSSYTMTAIAIDRYQGGLEYLQVTF